MNFQKWELFSGSPGILTLVSFIDWYGNLALCKVRPLDHVLDSIFFLEISSKIVFLLAMDTTIIFLRSPFGVQTPWELFLARSGEDYTKMI